MGTANLNGNVLSTIFVNPKYHGKGIGTKLIEFLEKKLRKKGHTSAVIPSSITAYSFYKQLGYKKIKTKITKNFGKVLIMEKEL